MKLFTAAQWIRMPENGSFTAVFSVADTSALRMSAAVLQSYSCRINGNLCFADNTPALPCQPRVSTVNLEKLCHTGLNTLQIESGAPAVLIAEISDSSGGIIFATGKNCGTVADLPVPACKNPAAPLRDGGLVRALPTADSTVFEFAHLCSGIIVVEGAAAKESYLDIELDAGHGWQSAEKLFCTPGHNKIELGCKPAVCRRIRITGNDFHTEFAGMTELGRPELFAHPFRCSSAEMEHAFEIAARVLRIHAGCYQKSFLCSADDARSLRFQLLAGYSLWGNYSCAANQLRTFPKLFRCTHGGCIAACPERAVEWLLALYEYELYSGTSALFEELQSTVPDILDSLQKTGRTDEIFLWDLRGTLLTASRMFRAHGIPEKADELNVSANQIFSRLVKNPVPAAKSELCIRRLLHNANTKKHDLAAVRLHDLPVNAAELPRWIQAVMLRGSNSDRQRLHQQMRPLCAALSESSSADLCAAVLFYITGWLTGITPALPGFREFLFRPFPGNETALSATLYTPRGLLPVRWRRKGLRAPLETELNPPAGCRPVIKEQEGIRILLKKP